MGINEEFDEMLREIGGFGRYQVRQYVLFSLCMMFGSVSFIGFIFTAAIVPHRCMVETCGETSKNYTFQTPWLNQAVPFNDHGVPHSCLMYQSLNDSSNTCSFNKDVEECSSLVYNGEENTIQTEFGLACPDNEWKLALVGTAHGFGAMIGLPLAGFFSDRFGRKTTLTIVLVMSSVLCLVKTLATNYGTFMFLEALEAIFGGNIFSICFILAFEMVTPNKRILGYMVIVISFAMGNAIVGGVAWAVKDWRYILYTTCAPALLFVFYYWLLPESVRWLIARGRLGDAKKQILHAAKVNKVTLGKEWMKDWQNGQIYRVDKENNGDSLWKSLKQVSKSRVLLVRLAVCSFCWISADLIYYGLSLNSVEHAGTANKYVNFILTSMVEAPSYIVTWVSLKKLGRRMTLCLTFLLCGVACFASPFVPESYRAVRLPIYLLGKFAITSSYDTLYVFTAEIYPTKLRNSLLGICNMMGRFGTMIAPQTPLMSRLTPLFPLVFFGALSTAAGFLALLLPETRGKPLPVTIKEAEDLNMKTVQPKSKGKPVVENQSVVTRF
ncbi:organic cation transporter protein-like [Cloeon dipterum]|uniref:organic cation transporter protein-like n=1 Tax=Cloeon dipterum TaxID=197152 RepID=UPI00321F644F